MSNEAWAQNNAADSTDKDEVTMKEIIISANKAEETRRTVSQQVQVIKSAEMKNLQAQSTADLLINSGNVFIQKSQQGGGSITLRGFEANRVLIVIDGVRMNNLIYRGGHLHNIVTTDNNSLDRLEVVFGPSSTIYGSDALGGVVHLFTRKPQLSSDGVKTNFQVNAMSRYASVNNESTSHVDFNIGHNKLASMTSITFSRFGDLKGGRTQNPFYNGSYGERPYYVSRINGQDSLVTNSEPHIQNPSGYSQYDVLQKFLFQQNDHVSHGINLQFSNSTDVPRYDRLTDPSSDGGLVNAEWYYGPQTRLMGAYDLNIRNEESFFRQIHVGLNYQAVEESRHTRRFNNPGLASRTENVQVIGANIDLQRRHEHHNIRFGLDAQYNMLTSTASIKNIENGTTDKLSTRYPDGDNTMLNTALYISHTWNINESLTLVDGLRAGYITLQSTFVDTSFFKFPFTTVQQKNPVFSGSFGLISSPDDNWKLSLTVATGFRAPNIDDLSKVFDSAPGFIIVPNSNLKPEKTVNYELGVTNISNNKTRWENYVYYTHFFDAIVIDKFKFNNEDSILYDGVLSEVVANQNRRKASIFGFSSNVHSQCSEHLFLTFTMNYTYGRIHTDTTNYPLDHISPFMSRFQLAYKKGKFNSSFFINFNGPKKLKDYYLDGEDNEQYATEMGMPAWFTANVRFSYQLHKLITLQTGVDNIFDIQYRHFASGINAPGRNIFATIRFHY
jgi:hemoglobin/transferrin/lactoferrin receptor protein